MCDEYSVVRSEYAALFERIMPENNDKTHFLRLGESKPPAK